MKKKLLFSILGVLTISALTFGITYSYFESLSQVNITGEATGGINTELLLEKIYHASKLVPLNDDLIKTAISKSTNKCIDKSGYEVCSLYKITLENKIDSVDALRDYLLSYGGLIVPIFCLLQFRLGTHAHQKDVRAR